MNENEKRIFADVAAENEEYARILKSSRRSAVFLGIIWAVFAVVLSIMTKDVYMLVLLIAMAVLMLVSFLRTNMLLKKRLEIYSDRVCFNNGNRDEQLELTPEEYSIELKLKPTKAGYSIHLIFRDKSEEKKKLIEYVSCSLWLPSDKTVVADWQAELESLGCEIIDPQGILSH